MPLCPSCGEENPERARFCLNCGSPLQEAAPAPTPRAPDEERKLDTLVFVDLVGSTALAEQLDPEDVLALLELYYSRLRTELERHGGTVEKYIGDAIVTHFGVPVAHEDDPERAVRAALDILQTVEALNAEDPIREIKVRIGVATGEVIVRHDQRAEDGKGIAWGDVLNTAARIESAAPVNGILVGEQTYRATAHRIEYRDHEPIEAKGKDEPVPVWEAVGVEVEAPARGRARDAVLVGRTAELERLLGAWSRVRIHGRPALATIVGDPGIGKSRLLTEFAHRVSGEADVLWGRCLSYGEGITYWPVEEMLEGAAGILKSDDPETASGKLGVLLDRFGAEDPDGFRTIAATLANLIGISGPEDPAAADMSQAELHWGIRRVLELTAATRPLMLVFEDLHWAEPTLFDLIEFLGEAQAPILLVGSARRELLELRPDFCTDTERRTTLFLSALGEEDSEALLADLLGDRALPAGSRAEMLLKNAAGNPLFLEETVRMLDDAGVFDGTGDLADLAVPTSLQAMIGSRLDGLPNQDKSVAHHASVVGMTFWSRAVAELHGTEAVDPTLEALERRDFVRSADDSSLADEREWSFKHALIRDVAYARVPKGRRAHLHVRFADWMQGIPGAAEELVEILAYHLEQACKHAGVGRSDAPPPVERAVDALIGAAEKAERREGIREADRYYERALELLGDAESEQALEVRLARAGTLNKLGEPGRADELFASVAESALALGRSDLRGRALVGRANVANRQGRATEARTAVTEATAIALEAGLRSLEVRALFESTSIRLWFEGDVDTAVQELRAALAIAESLDDKTLQVETHLRMGTLLYNVGSLHQAENQLTTCSALSRELESLRFEAQTAFLLGLVKYHVGELAEAERLGIQAREWLERTGEALFQLQNLRALALCAAARSDYTLAEERLREALPLAIETGGPFVVEIDRCLVDVLVSAGRTSEARELAAEARESVPAEDNYGQAAILLIDATIDAADGQGNPAVKAFSEALRILEELQLPLDLVEARLAYGRALRRLGDEAAAQAELQRAREDCAPMGARGLIDLVDRELAEIEGAAPIGPLV